MKDYGKAGQKRGAGRRLGDWNNRVVGCKADSAFRSSVPTQEKGDRTGISDLLRKTTFLVCDSWVSSRFQQQIHNFNKFTRRRYKNKTKSHWKPKEQHEMYDILNQYSVSREQMHRKPIIYHISVSILEFLPPWGSRVFWKLLDRLPRQALQKLESSYEWMNKLNTLVRVDTPGQMKPFTSMLSLRLQL